LFQIGFQKSLVGQVQKVEDIGIAEIIFGGQRRWFHLGDFLFRFGLNRRFVLAGQQALVIELADLSLQCADTPMLLNRFLLIPASGVGVFDARQDIVMRPAQFERHRLPNRKHHIKAPHIAQVGGIKAFAEFRRQLF
jgi:hypothetical protein